jgi:hypothetical protein
MLVCGATGEQIFYQQIYWNFFFLNQVICLKEPLVEIAKAVVQDYYEQPLSKQLNNYKTKKDLNSKEFVQTFDWEVFKAFSKDCFEVPQIHND